MIEISLTRIALLRTYLLQQTYRSYEVANKRRINLQDVNHVYFSRGVGTR